MAATMANRLSQKSSLSARVAVRREVTQTCVEVDQARHDRKQQSEDDEPGGAFVPQHHGSLGIDDVENQRGDEASEWDRVEEPIDALGNDGATRVRDAGS